MLEPIGQSSKRNPTCMLYKICEHGIQSQKSSRCNTFSWVQQTLEKTPLAWKQQSNYCSWSSKTWKELSYKQAAGIQINKHLLIQTDNEFQLPFSPLNLEHLQVHEVAVLPANYSSYFTVDLSLAQCLTIDSLPNFRVFDPCWE